MRALRHWSVRHARLLRSTYEIGAAYSRALLRPVLRVAGRGPMEQVLRPLERGVKSLFFDCQMCGQCVLSKTGMACPTNCAKQMRNGPCGGVRADGNCEVIPSMRCVWLEAMHGIAGVKRPEEAREPLPPIDHRRMGTSSWVRIIAGEVIPTPMPPPPAPVPTDPAQQGPFERACRSGRFVVTVEVPPPDSADPHALLERAGRFRHLADAINITDGAGGNCHMSSMAAAALLVADGLTPVAQFACRDRNRIAIQGDMLGAAALGVRNVLCLTGDDVMHGDQPEAKPVFDLDAVSLLHIARRMCAAGEFASGRKLEQAPRLFLGATANPFAPPYADRVDNLEKKIAAGAAFIQTQFCFDLERFEEFMRAVCARGLHRRAALIVGVGTLVSAAALKRMRERVPGVHVPDTIIARIAGAADQKSEGRQVCVDMIRALRGIEGVAGVHLMGYRNEETLARIIEESGVRPDVQPRSPVESKG
jgi:methylenetetrahydrofolate reductase (NADPH)